MGESDRVVALEAELAKAREHAELLTSILLHAPDFLTHLTLDGHFLFLNRFAAGFTAEHLKGATIYDFTDASYHQEMRETIARAVETRAVQSYESIAVSDNAAPAHYFNRVTPKVDADGVVRSVVLISTDVTRLKQAERALAESEAMLQHVLRTSGMGTWWWDRDRDEGGHDEALAAIMGTDAEGADLARMMRLVHPDDVERIQANLAAVTDTHQYGPLEHRFVRPDGTIRWVSTSARLLTIGGRTRLVGGTLDITERKRLEERVAQSQKMESIGRLAGGIAHDFNNMLTAILSYSQFALAAVPAGSRVARDINEIQRAGERSAALTAQLLAFARQQRIAPTVIDLNAIVLRVDSLLRRVLGADIEVTTLLDARGRVKVDINQFEQVIVNLATNARDAMQSGGHLKIRTSDITVDADAEVPAGAYVSLAVTDTGTGIAPELRSRIFEPFFTTKELGKGTGLGLATCYGVVAQAGGHITVDSEVGNGSTFTIYLPRVEGAVTAMAPATPREDVAGSETILVVEDEPNVRAVTVKALERLGYRVLAAMNGSEALAVAQDYSGPIDLLVTDVVMPGMSGTQLAPLLLRVRPDLAVLFVSGYTDDAILRDQPLGGEVDFLEKPFSPAVLAARVRHALDRRRTRR